ncbi:MAG: UDP-N-acetylglucosamine 2-epimerase, partial [Holosporaceae bacterium]|nr:UDP-N-acetylglucosamine 2-epimerase [Holosporaceae bacterium]
VSSHREENVDNEQNLTDLIETLGALVKEYNYPIIFSTHPRTELRLRSITKTRINPKIVFSKPFGFFDYIKLQKNAFCTLSDSGTITEESSILKFPAVTIRDQHERPEGMDEGTLIMCGLKKDAVLDAINVTTKQNSHDIKIVEDYDVARVSKKIVKIILSYTNYINRNIWKKDV